MTVIETNRRGSPGTLVGSPAPATGGTPAEAPDPSGVAAFREGRGEEQRLVDLLAFALAAERQQTPTPDAIDRLRHEATAALSDHAFRYLHNTVEQVRRDAVAEHLGRFRKPPGFLSLVAANLVALALVAGAGCWLALHPETLAGLSGLFTG